MRRVDPALTGLSFLIVGLGSAGYRHMKNLRDLGVERISLLRTGNGPSGSPRLLPFPVEPDLASALAARPTGVLISNPTSLHMETALAAAKAGCHLFIEKPVSHSWSGVRELRREVQARSLVVATGFQFRFHPLLLSAKQWLDERRVGTVVSAHARYGEYLPSWHPGEDYRKGYSGRADLGGGPVHTLCHPFDYLRWLLGDILSVAGAVGKLSLLEIDTEDTAHALLRFERGAIGSVELDYIHHPKEHFLRIVGEGGDIFLDFEGGLLRLDPFDGGDRWALSTPPRFERNTMFLDEMKNFLAAILGSELPACTLDDGLRALEISLAVHRSSQERREIDVGIPF